MNRITQFTLVASILCLAGCDDGVPRNSRATITRVERGDSGEADLFRDRETGCFYIRYGGGDPLMSRLGEDGKPMCGFPQRPADPRLRLEIR